MCMCVHTYTHAHVNTYARGPIQALLAIHFNDFSQDISLSSMRELFEGCIGVHCVLVHQT